MNLRSGLGICVFKRRLGRLCSAATLTLADRLLGLTKPCTQVRRLFAEDLGSEVARAGPQAARGQRLHPRD